MIQETLGRCLLSERAGGEKAGGERAGGERANASKGGVHQTEFLPPPREP